MRKSCIDVSKFSRIVRALNGAAFCHDSEAAAKEDSSCRVPIANLNETRPPTTRQRLLRAYGLSGYS